MTEQGYPPHQPDQPGRYGRSKMTQEPRRNGWQMLGAFDAGPEQESEPPPWAVPGGIEPIRPARRPRPPMRADEPASGGDAADARPARAARPRRGRAAATRRRRSRRRLVTWGSTLVVVLVAVGGGYYFLSRPAPRSGLVTTLLKGEYRTVPNACRVLPPVMLSKYLAGTPKSLQPFNDPAQTQCTYTVDAQPTFRILNVTVTAYQPSLTVPVGDGSATAAATYTFAQQRRLLADPPKNTAQPAAAITIIRGLGSESLSAVQVFHVGSVTDRVTVLTRFRNVLILASLQGQASGGFGPVALSDLQAGALAVARAMLAQVKVEPAVGG